MADAERLGTPPLITAAEFAQRHLVRVRDVKRVLKRHKIGVVDAGVRRFPEAEMLALLSEKISRIQRQRSRALVGTVLVVDDDESNLDFVERTLRGHYTVSRALGGAEALAALRQKAAEVIIADQRMPGMTGTEFLAESTRVHPDAIRILLSAYSDAAALTEAINTAKVHHFLSKPIAPDALLAKIGEAFEELRRVRHVQAILLGDAHDD